MTLKDGHNIGDDFSQYILNAQNILAHKAYACGIMLDNFTLTPPGFPLLLAPAIQLFGLNWKILKALNILFWYCSVFLLYRIFRQDMGSTRAAIGCAFLLAASSFFFVFKQNVLSDIPFFFFICSSFYAMRRYGETKARGDGGRARGWLVLFFIFITCAFWIRPAGIVLFASAFFYFLAVKREANISFWILFVLLVNMALGTLWTGPDPRVSSFLTVLAHRPFGFALSFVSHFATVFRSLGWFFYPAQTRISYTLFTLMDHAVFVMAPLLFLIVAGVFLCRVRTRTASFMECFSFFYLSIFIVWSGYGGTPVDAFTRFVLPLLPFVFIFMYQGLARINLRPLGRVVFGVVLSVNVFNIASNWEFNDDVINLKETQELVAWVKGHVGQGEHFMFYRPRFLALLTSRVGTGLLIAPGPYSEIFERIFRLKIEYVIMRRSSGFTAVLESRPSDFSMVWENSFYKIFKTHVPCASGVDNPCG